MYSWNDVYTSVLECITMLGKVVDVVGNKPSQDNAVDSTVQNMLYDANTKLEDAWMMVEDAEEDDEKMV